MEIRIRHLSDDHLSPLQQKQLKETFLRSSHDLLMRFDKQNGHEFETNKRGQIGKRKRERVSEREREREQTKIE